MVFSQIKSQSVLIFGYALMFLHTSTFMIKQKKWENGGYSFFKLAA